MVPRYVTSVVFIKSTGQPGPMVRRLRKRLKRLSKAYRKVASRLSSSVRNRLAQVLARRRGHDLRRIDHARSSHLPRPDFIIIGAPKCGTSWLQRVLGQHPEVTVVPDEIEYFSAHLDFPLEWYLSHFARAARAASASSGTPRVIGEKSARYCSMPPDRIRLVHGLLPDAKLILMTRDPVARHWSQAKRYFSKRRFNKRGDSVLAIPRDELFDFFERMRPLGEFSVMISNWLAVYPPRQLLIISQERALARPRDVYDAVLDHIGASRHYDPVAIKLLQAETNVGPKLPMPADIAEHLETMFASERDRYPELLGDRTGVYADH